MGGYGTISPNISALISTTTETGGANTATTAVTPVTPSGTANTKGTYVQLIAATNKASKSILIVAYPQGNNNWLFDIATGASGSEIPLINNLFIEGSNYSNPLTYFLPLQIPAGTRISARSQSTSATPVNMEVIILE